MNFLVERKPSRHFLIISWAIVKPYPRPYPPQYIAYSNWPSIGLILMQSVRQFTVYFYPKWTYHPTLMTKSQKMLYFRFNHMASGDRMRVRMREKKTTSTNMGSINRFYVIAYNIVIRMGSSIDWSICSCPK